MPSPWGIRVLGTLEVVVDGRVVDVGARRNREVLAALALDAGRVVPSAVLLDRVWGTDAAGASTTNLHAIVSRLRSRLTSAGIADAVVTRDPGYALQVDPDAVDGIRFGRLLGLARQRRGEGALLPAHDALQEALGLWRGRAYADVRSTFAELEAARLEEQRLAALELGADLDLALGRHAEVVEDLSALVDSHPLREGLRGCLMVALYRTGRQADALQVYEQGRIVLSEELGLDPGPELQRLHRAVLTQDPSLIEQSTEQLAERAAGRPVAPSRPEPAAVRGLVVPPTLLFGRQPDVDAVSALLRGNGRLVTLIGPGGVGKTRLAAAVSDVVGPDFADGTVQVSLAPVAGGSDVVATIARAAGLTGVDDLDAVAAHIGESRMLLVLDNFEHLLSAAPAVGRLVALCPRLAVLATSRSPLRLRAEREYVVEPLGLPPADARTEAELVSAPSGALLLDRARTVAPRTGHSADDVGALAELCHRLSGLPLAIELVTARMRTLAPRALLDRLDTALSAPGARDLPERQRTMRTALDWSFGLLTPEQQRVFTLLGLFRGGAELAAVEHVATSDGFEPEAVLELLDALVMQSLVRVTHAPDGTARFAMLEPVGEYARSLVDGGRAERLLRRHADWFAALAVRAAAGYEREDQVTWLARTELDEANLVAAVERSLDLGDDDTAGSITWSLWLYWWLRGGLAVGRRLAEHCLAADLSPVVRPRVRLAAATMSYAQGDQTAAAEHWAEASRLAEAIDDPEVLAKSCAGTGLAAMARGDLELAAERFRLSLDLCDRAGEHGVWMSSLAQVWLGTTLLVQGRPDDAVEAIRRGLDVAEARGDRLSTYVALYNLTQAALVVGDDEAARHHLAEGITLSEQTGDRANLAYFLESLAVVESRADSHSRVAALLAAAEVLREDVGSVYAYYLPDESLRAAAEKTAREALGEDGYAAAVTAGGAMVLAEVLAFARG